jgi:GTP-binding protein
LAKFTDTISIGIRAGKGGPGSVSFRREKYIPKGGPDGGDGGKGGDVYFVADRRYYNLSHFFPDKIYSAQNGKTGMGKNKYGLNGEDLIINVPPGTQVIDADTDELIADLIEEDIPVLAAKGGIGGKGNAFFKTSTHRTPRFSQPGMEGEEFRVLLNLKLIADIGLVGLPNAGKSTLLSKLTNAKPKIADYPFTTLIPNLGVVERKNGTFYKIADIPGIIEGAHKGLGLGLSFLQHIERVKGIIYLIDCREEDMSYNLKLLKSELGTYNESLLKKPYLIAVTKIDLISAEELKTKLAGFKEKKIIPLSSVSGENLDDLLKKIDKILEKKDAKKGSSKKSKEDCC